MSREALPEYVHSDELHRLETEGSLNDDRQDGQKPIGVGVLDESCTGDGARVLPVLEPSSRSIRATTEGDNKTDNDEPNN